MGAFHDGLPLVASRLDAEKRRGDAGQLCCLVAEMLFVVYKRTDKWPSQYANSIAVHMINFFLAGIKLLLRSELAVTSFETIEKVLAAVEVCGRRGCDVSEARKELQEIEEWRRTHVWF